MATQKWVANDGKLFDSQADAENYEHALSIRNEVKIFMVREFMNMDEEARNLYYRLIDDKENLHALADFLVMTDVASHVVHLLSSKS